MQPIEWTYPRSISEALNDLSVPGALAVAGGTTVLDLMKLGLPMGSRLVDLSGLSHKGVEIGTDVLRIGALTSNSAVASAPQVRAYCPGLSEAILAGASQQLRNAATIGGNLMQATRCGYFRASGWPCNRRLPASGCPALEHPDSGHAVLGTSQSCIATHPSDMAVALLALDATILWQGPQSSGRIAMSDFFRLPGDRPDLQTNLPAGALITEVEIPHRRAAQNSGYLKLRGRASYEFASASVAAALWIDDGTVRDISVGLGGLGTVPWRVPDAEQVLIGQSLSADVINQLLDSLLAGADTRPVTQHKIALARGAVHHLLLRLAAS